MREIARQLPAAERGRAARRTQRALAAMGEAAQAVRFSTWPGDMGEAVLAGCGLPAVVPRSTAASPREASAGPAGVAVTLTSAEDTRAAARALQAAGVDILVFAGGDGTARDVLDALGTSLPVLGIPAGVKMHSGVFAVSPEAAGAVLMQLAQGNLVNLTRAEVRDIDEEAFRGNVVRSRFYGEMRVPCEGHFLQQTKVGGREDPQLAAADIADGLVEQLQPGRTYLVGPGSTTAAVMAALGLPNTLLGVDVVRDGRVVAADATADTLLLELARAPGEASIVVTAIGGQGHVFGRGNQQFSPQVIRAVGVENVIIVAAKSKLAGLGGRPLLVDTNDPELDGALTGYRTVVTGYNDQVLYRVSMGGR
ncbi:MAG: NAD(+)/NADH kinase [Halioglobus sp.]|nr:NAD(+)/NADH kinase [Halioglobus sp.]